MYNVTKRLPFYACLRTPKLSSRISGVGYRRQSCVAPDHLGNSSMRKKHQAIGVTATFTGHPGAFSLESGFLQGCRRAVNLVMPVGHMINRTLHGHLPAEPEPLVEGKASGQGSNWEKSLTGVATSSYRQESRTPSLKGTWEESGLKTSSRRSMGWGVSGLARASDPWQHYNLGVFRFCP